MILLLMLAVSISFLAWLAGIFYSLWKAGAWIHKKQGLRGLIAAISSVFVMLVFVFSISLSANPFLNNTFLANLVLLAQVFSVILFLFFSIGFAIAGLSAMLTHSCSVVALWRKQNPVWRFLIIAVPLDFLVVLLHSLMKN
jgi:hypothetical protein